MNTNHEAQHAPLDLTQFEGHAPEPWTAELNTAMQGQPLVVLDANRKPVVYSDATGPYLERCTRRTISEDDWKRMSLIAAAPTLLAECKRQRSELAELRDEAAALREALEKIGTTPTQHLRYWRV